MCPSTPCRDGRGAVIGSNVNGSNSSNVSQSLGVDAALAAENKLLRFSEHFRNVDVATVMINKKLAKVRPGLTTYYARHTWVFIAFNLGIQKDVVSLALGHSFGVRVTDTYINADLSRVDEANRSVIDYVLYNKK